MKNSNRQGTGFDQNSLVGRMLNNDFQNHSIIELDHIYTVMNEIIENLDEIAINEILQGNIGDIDNLFKTMFEETVAVLMMDKTELNPSSTHYLNNVTNCLDDYLKKKSLNYFVATTLPTFDLQWYHIEWFNMIQLYRLLCIEAARGHCFGKNTPILMFDGSIKKVQDIEVGDLVMGPDSTSRKVLSLHRGLDKLYEISQHRGDSYVINSNHTLSLYKKYQHCWWNKKHYYKPSSLEEINIKEYLSLSKTKREELRGYKVITHYPEKEILIDPYFLGLWLGDGTSMNQHITNIDKEIIDFIKQYSVDLGLRYATTKDEKTHRIVKDNDSIYKNKLLQYLKEYDLLDNKHIPKDYLINSKEVRLKLLAGLIDSDGTMRDNRYQYCSIDYNLILDVKRLCDSLGMRTNIMEFNNWVGYLKRRYKTYVIAISGNLEEVPVKLERKKVKYNGKGTSYKKPDELEGYEPIVISKLKVRQIGFGEYFGFECDKDHRFLLGDNTVAHNSKSFSFSWAYPLWKMYKYDRPTSMRPIIPLETKLCKEGMLITNEFKLARKLLKKVKEEIISNDILARKLKPDGRADGGFGNDSLTCKNGAQLDLSSFHSSNRGPHPGYIILDDFLDKSALYSNEQREKFWEVFTAEISNMLLPSGQMCVVGTPFSQQDLYGRLKEDDRWKVFEYPAIFPDGRVLYPERFPFNELMALKKSLGTLIFTREILVKPVSDISSIFPYPNCLNNSIIGMQGLKLVDNIQSFPMKFKKVSVGADFAISGNIAADFTVYTVWGMSSLDEYYLLYVFRGQGLTHHQQISELQRINSNFQPDVIIAEANGFQRVMIQLAQESGIKNIQEFITDGWNKKDLYEGLPSLAVLFERGSIKMPYGDEHSKNMVNLIHSEFNSITFNDDKGKLEASSGHDDTAMSSFFGIKGINQINNELRISLV